MNYNNRKQVFNTLTIAQLFGVVIIVAAVYILTLLFPHQTTMQYLDKDKNLVTETFNTREGFNERAQELKADSISYWLHHE